MSRVADRPTVLIADDHTVVAEGLAVTLRPWFAVVGQVTELDDLLDAIREHSPDLVLLDLSFRGVSSLPLLSEATADRRIRSKFVILTAYASKALSSAAIKAGARGFVLKGASTEDLRLALEAALVRRRPAFGDDAEAVLDAGGPTDTLEIGGAALRPRHVAILNLLLAGLDYDEIGDELGITAKGVEYHLTTLRDLLGMPNARLLTLWATEHQQALRQALKGKDDAARLVPRKRR